VLTHVGIRSWEGPSLQASTTNRGGCPVEGGLLEGEEASVGVVGVQHAELCALSRVTCTTRSTYDGVGATVTRCTRRGT
jgi:hypothetical protein